MWELLEPGRWWEPIWTDTGGVVSPRKLLLHASGVFAELHRDTVFVYAAPAVINPDSPLDGATWRRTVEDAVLPDGDGPDVWAVLEAIAAEPLPDDPGPPSA